MAISCRTQQGTNELCSFIAQRGKLKKAKVKPHCSISITGRKEKVENPMQQQSSKNIGISPANSPPFQDQVYSNGEKSNSLKTRKYDESFRVKDNG